MYKNKLLLLVLALIIFAQFTNSQNNTNSPYTRFGYGDISDTNNGEQRAMGGVSIGSRSNTSINTVNPASYSSVDSLSFMFDVGTSALISHFSEQTGAKTAFNANLEYITMRFRLSRLFGFSAGVLPYSSTGYNFYKYDSTYIKNTLNSVQKLDTIHYTKSFAGTGGFSQVYMGLSAKITKHLSVGANVYYIYGTINNYRDVSFNGTSVDPLTSTSTTIRGTISANNLKYRFGAQYYNTFNDKHSISVGIIYEPKVRLNGGFSQITVVIINDTIDSRHPKSNYIKYGFDLPTLYGIGINYTYNNRYTFGMDYSMQEWKNAEFFSKTDSLKNRSKLALGFEYQPNPTGRKLSDHMRYRAGFNVSDSYYNVYGVTQPKNYSITCGLGLPLYDRRTNTMSMLNASFEYGKIGSAALSENYYKFTLNIAFNEHWFMKRKL